MTAFKENAPYSVELSKKMLTFTIEVIIASPYKKAKGV